MIDPEAGLLGGEIHDEIIPLLFASSANVHRLIRELDGSTAGKIDDKHLNRLRDVAKWLDESMLIGRQLICGVFPPDFQERSWPQRAAAHLDQLNSQASDLIHWTIDENAVQLDSEVAFAAMRITVEACRNAIRHGRATKIDVHACLASEKLRLTIQDNGTGFDPEEIPEGHFGLRVMEQRACHAGGALSFESKQGEGTVVQFTTS